MVYIPTELVVAILQRLPWTSLRRLRLVSRSWRDLIHLRTTEMQQCRDAVPLVVTTESAYLIDDLADSSYYGLTCKPRKLWPSDDVHKHKEVVGVCNGVLCLCDNGAKPGGVITLANPATGDVLELPPIPCAGLFRRHNTRCSGRSWHQAYSFGYNHRTGQYKVVHVPCFFKIKETLHVFTVGEASWREVPAAPDAKCKLEAGIVSANGSTYWVADERDQRIMCFDHDSERVACTTPLPNSVKVRARPILHLTEVQRRLSVTVASSIVDFYKPHHERPHPITEVWILESASKVHTWIHQYNLLALPLPGPSMHLAQPNFIHGEHVLIVGRRDVGQQGQKLYPYWCQPPYSHEVIEPGAVHVNHCHHMKAFSYMNGDVSKVFTYIKTTEALSVYKRW